MTGTGTKTKIGSKVEVKCDWCKNDNTTIVGTEYNGMAILGCGSCGHEWVMSGMIIDKKQETEFWDSMDRIVKDFTREQGNLPKRKRLQ